MATKRKIFVDGKPSKLKYIHGTEGLHRSGKLIRTRPAQPSFIRGGGQVAYGARSVLASRLKTARNQLGRKAAFHIKKQAEMHTRLGARLYKG